MRFMAFIFSLRLRASAGFRLCGINFKSLSFNPRKFLTLKNISPFKDQRIRLLNIYNKKI